MSGTKQWNLNLLVMMLTQLHKINSASVVCAPVVCPPRSSRKNHRFYSLSSFTFWSLSSLSGLLMYWNNIFIENSNDFFPCCTTEASACKINRANAMAQYMRTFSGWKNRRYFEQWIWVTRSFFYQINFSVLLPQVRFPWSSYIENDLFPSHIFRTCVHAKLLRDHLKGFF